jgi:hypothetical protein
MSDKRDFLVSAHVSSPTISNAGTEGTEKIIAAIKRKEMETPIRYQINSKVPLGIDDKPTA